MSSEQKIQVGVVLDESVEFSVSEICHTCHIHAEVVIQVVDVSVIEPRGEGASTVAN